MKLSDFDYELPEELIAQLPADERDRSRLLVLRRAESSIEHRSFFQIADYTEEGDALVINDTKVFPARLFGRKETGGRVDVLLLDKTQSHKKLHKDSARDEWAGEESVEEWTALINAAKHPREGSKISFDDDLHAEVISRHDEIYTIILRAKGKLADMIRRKGFTPLPPYIRRNEPGRFEEIDRKRYQAVYAREEGAVAAPTAGLHFTENLLRKIEGKGVDIIPLTLRIGFATFNPVRTAEIETHRMHSEYCRLPESSAERINRIKRSGGRIFAVGTTVVRTLEFFASEDGTVRAGEGMNALFIYPGYRFKAVDSMITNFHLPQSTLLMLVCAFAGREKIFQAYRAAVDEKYRFYSYGDSMLIL